MESLRFHHIGYAVKDIQQTAEFYLKQGWTITREIVDPIQNTNIAFLQRDNFPLIELVSPVDETSPVYKNISRGGVQPYHICYSVEDINKAIKELRQEKFIALFAPVPAVAIENKKICYLYSNKVGLIELVER